MKLNRVCATALATTMTAGIVLSSAPTVYAADADPVRNAAQAAFDYWAPKLMQSNPVFSIPGAPHASQIEWVLPVTDNANLIDAAARADEDFRNSLQSPPKLSELTGGVDKITAAVTDDGHLVAVLPFGKANISNGKVSLDEMVSGAMIQATEDKDSLVPIAAPDGAIRLLYDVVENGKHTTTGFDLIDGVNPLVTISGLEVAYDNGKSDSPDFQSITNLVITPINPETANRIKEVVRVLNGQDKDVTSILEVLRTPRDGEQGDPSKGGLLPVTGPDGKPLVEEKSVAPGKSTVEHTIEFVSPEEGDQVYLVHRVVDAEGVNVVQPDMRTLPSLKPTLDVQASSQEGSRKLAGHGKQTIYNQAKVRQLTPGKPYQVLVNLSQCNPTDGCVEVAAVNREIIPRDTTERTENFAVDIDTSQIADDNTFEWSTSVYEGTGDVKNMGAKLAAVDDHPSSQVLSFSGNGSSLNKNGAGERTVQHSDAGQLEIKDEAPPVSMEEVRANNAKLDADAEGKGSSWVWAAGAGVVGLLALAGAALWQRNRSTVRGEGA